MSNNVNLIKELPRKPGEAISNRYQVKRFRDMQAADKFLNKQYDNDWKVLRLEKPLKSGVYFSQGFGESQRYINVKELLCV